MAKLDKLQIAGIRNYSQFEDKLQTIKFGSPLTLFLGGNGCGKTTIIEALRYAFTGDVPEGSERGHTFVNDPRLAGLGIVKGQVRLRVIDIQGREITINRNIEARRKGKKDISISNIKPTTSISYNGEKASNTGRCLDVNAFCAELLDVTPAIINNVIFCHQDNALWPLDEPKKVKEIFDKIFESDKYNSFIEVLRKQLKDIEIKLKIIAKEVEWKRHCKENVEKLRNRLSIKQDKLTSLRDGIKDIRNNLTPLNKRIEEIKQIEILLVDLQKQLNTYEDSLKNIIEQQKDLKRKIKNLFKGDEDDLKRKINMFNHDKNQEETQINNLYEKKEKINEKFISIRKEIEQLQGKLILLKEEKHSYDKKLEEQQLLIKNAEVLFNINNFQSDNIIIILNELDNNITETNLKIKNFKQKSDNEENEMQKKIDHLRETRAATNNSLKMKQEEIKNNKKKIQDLEMELDTLKNSQAELHLINEKLNKTENTLAKLKEEFEKKNVTMKIDELEEDIEKNEKEFKNLEKQYRVLQENNVIETKIESNRMSIIEKNQLITKIRNKNFDNFQLLFGNQIPDNDFKNHINNIKKIETDNLNNIDKKIKEKENIISTLKANLKHQENTLESIKEDIKNKEKQIFNVCLYEKFDNCVQNVYNKKEQLQKDKGKYVSIKTIYETFLNDFELEKPNCPVCFTNFNSKNDVKEIKQKICKIIEDVPKNLNDVENQLIKEEELYNKLQQLKPINEELHNLKNTKLKQLKDEYKKLNNELTNNIEELNDLIIESAQPEKLIQICNNIISDVALLDEYMMNIKIYEENINSDTNKLVKIDSNFSRQELEQKLDDIDDILYQLRKQKDTNMLNINKHKERCQQIIDQKNVEFQKKLELQQIIQNKPHMEQEIEETDARIINLDKEINNLEKTHTDINNELYIAEQKKKTVSEENKLIIAKETENLRLKTNAIEEMKKLQMKIQEYLNKNIDNSIKEISTELDNQKSLEEKLKENEIKIIDIITEKKENLAKQEVNYRDLHDNLDLKDKEKQEKLINDNINNIKIQINNHNYNVIKKEKDKILQEIEKYESEISENAGQERELVNSVDELLSDLNKPENKSAFKEYNKKIHEQFVFKHVIHDLEIYISALEKSILKFHTNRMKNINQLIKEYWRDVYRGNDIDYIEIKTEESTAKTKRRTYNYRVVENKRGIEVDMRGRCSAGQRVLACLIIRMALAETFSSNCGIFTLDEPTTNLDRENILSLCEMLTKIIEKRSSELSFQLIIITHDEDFINEITRMNGCNSYIRISRDTEGYSVVKNEYL